MPIEYLFGGTWSESEGAAMALNDALLHDYMRGFHGYGSYDAPYWLVGMEEGSTGTIEEIARRIEVWAERGRQELDDLVGFHEATGLDEWFQPGAKLQSTWKGLIRLLLAAEGEAEADVERVRSFQRSELGRAGGTNALFELFPLPKPGHRDWPYDEWSDIPCLESRKTYEQEMGPIRIRHLRARIRQHRPRAVVCYGRAPQRWFEKIAGLFAPCGLDRLQVASWDGTLVALIPHTSQGVSNRFLEGVGALIRDGLREARPGHHSGLTPPFGHPSPATAAGEGPSK